MTNAARARCSSSARRSNSDGIGDVEILQPTASPSRSLIATAPRIRNRPWRRSGKFVGAHRQRRNRRLLPVHAAAGADGRRTRCRLPLQHIIEQLEYTGGQISGVRTDSGTLTADHYVLALGSYSTSLLKSVGIGIPVYPVKGFSITVPISDPEMAPNRRSWTRRTRLPSPVWATAFASAARAQLSGFDLKLDAGRRKTLEFVVGDLFPKGGDVSQAEFWTGLRPMTPDGTPIIGGTRYSNLTLSTGHGTSAGPWPPAPDASSPTCSAAGNPRSPSTTSALRCYH